LPVLLNEGVTVTAARHGDTGAFRLLVEHYEKPIYGFIYRIVCDRELARDLAQDTFLAVFRALPRFKGGGFRPWLFKIALNCARQALRRRRLIAWLPWAPQYDAAPAVLDLSMEAQIVHQALAKLPTDLRIPLVLRLVQGFSYAEIAAIMGISQAAVRMRVLRARRMFRDEYAAMESEDSADALLLPVSGGGR
jgi:RNA polymerase sigma-70 factor, ECF subfamily